MPDDVSGVEGNQAAAGEEKMVPLTALEGVRAELKESKEATQQLKGQIELYKANAAHTPVQEIPDDLDGLKEDDVVTVADVKKIMGISFVPVRVLPIMSRPSRNTYPQC